MFTVRSTQNLEQSFEKGFFSGFPSTLLRVAERRQRLQVLLHRAQDNRTEVLNKEGSIHRRFSVVHEEVVSEAVTDEDSAHSNLVSSSAHAESSTPWVLAVLDDPQLVVLDICPSVTPLAHTSISYGFRSLGSTLPVQSGSS